MPTLVGDPRECERERDRDLVVGPPPLLPRPPLLEELEVELSREEESPPRLRSRLAVSPLAFSLLRELDLDLADRWFFSCRCFGAFLLAVVVGLDVFRPYLVGFLCRWRLEEDVGSGLGMESVVWCCCPSPAACEELVTGANTVSLLTCTSQYPCLPYFAASAANVR